MSVLDELREAASAASEWHDSEPTVSDFAWAEDKAEVMRDAFVTAMRSVWEETRSEVFAAIDAFSDAHPGLVDETVTYECGKCSRTIVTTCDEDRQRAFNRYCPACAKAGKVAP